MRFPQVLFGHEDGNNIRFAIPTPTQPLTGFKLWLEFSGHNFDFHFETIVTQSKIGLQWTAWFNLGLKTKIF